MSAAGPKAGVALVEELPAGVLAAVVEDAYGRTTMLRAADPDRSMAAMTEADRGAVLPTHCHCGQPVQHAPDHTCRQCHAHCKLAAYRAAHTAPAPNREDGQR